VLNFKCTCIQKNIVAEKGKVSGEYKNLENSTSFDDRADIKRDCSKLNDAEHMSACKKSYSADKNEASNEFHNNTASNGSCGATTYQGSLTKDIERTEYVEGGKIFKTKPSKCDKNESSKTTASTKATSTGSAELSDQTSTPTDNNKSTTERTNYNNPKSKETITPPIGDTGHNKSPTTVPPEINNHLGTDIRSGATGATTAGKGASEQTTVGNRQGEKLPTRLAQSQTYKQYKISQFGANVIVSLYKLLRSDRKK